MTTERSRSRLCQKLSADWDQVQTSAIISGVEPSRSLVDLRREFVSKHPTVNHRILATATRVSEATIRDDRKALKNAHSPERVVSFLAEMRGIRAQLEVVEKWRKELKQLEERIFSFQAVVTMEIEERQHRDAELLKQLQEIWTVTNLQAAEDNTAQDKSTKPFSWKRPKKKLSQTKKHRRERNYRPKKFGEYPDEVPTVRRIIELHKAGEFPSGIAHKLNEEGLKPRRGDKWTYSSVYVFLYNRKLLKTVSTEDHGTMPQLR